MSTNAKFRTSLRATHVPVQIVEEIITKKHGPYVRAITANGNKIVAPSRFFVMNDTTPMADVEQITLSASLAKLQQHWANK